MSPRPYRLGQRQANTEQTRSRIINATRELLMTSHGFTQFSIDLVARQADVARMTVYHQFGSKIGLLEALCDSLAASGGMEQLASAFQQPESRDALSAYITTFGHFWDADRLVTRRLRALAALDPEFEQVLHSRDERRRKGVRTLIERMAAQHGCPAPEKIEDAVAILFTLISFESFDSIAGNTRSLEEITPLICQLSQTAIEHLR
ncbi:hypothetical protein KDW_53140 [Dictyobacter vulcani]|uniref:HTH tetR-type domain-containing protein n=1 Tax=Dictyobacter vulcani TaxID=2607529 RepID=A0A5J4KVC8_9CHLR|nr:TetR/AcrR family transcriptional regulator [Dictyobacter vulcani]GER91152.1 hypothetical protein KDW_53140 [Dictyobacter vulcani]